MSKNSISIGFIALSLAAMPATAQDDTVSEAAPAAPVIQEKSDIGPSEILTGHGLSSPAASDVIIVRAVRTKKTSSRILDDGELSEHRGGETTVIAGQSFSGIINGNINGDFTAGNVTISDNAFSNFNGLGNVTINTGAQSLLQSGINLAITVSD